MGKSRTSQSYRRRRRWRTALGWCSVAAGIWLFNPSTDRGGPWILYNSSPSVPTGFYRRQYNEEVGVGTLVQFRIPAAAHSYVIDRFGHVGTSWTILKPVVAVEGDHVCARGLGIRVNGRYLGPMIEHDSQGRPLPVWRDCRDLEPGELFVCSLRIPNSFDSRTYGPFRAGDVLGVYRALWVDSDATASQRDAAGSGSGSILTGNRWEIQDQDS